MNNNTITAALLFSGLLSAQGGMGLLGADPGTFSYQGGNAPVYTPPPGSPAKLRVFAGIYDCTLIGNQVPATQVSIDCTDNKGTHTKQTILISSTVQSWFIAAPPTHTCVPPPPEHLWPPPCAPADEIHFSIQAQSTGPPAWTLSAASAASGVTMQLKGKI